MTRMYLISAVLVGWPVAAVVGAWTFHRMVTAGRRWNGNEWEEVR